MFFGVLLCRSVGREWLKASERVMVVREATKNNLWGMLIKAGSWR